MNTQRQPLGANINPSALVVAPQEPEEAGGGFGGLLSRRMWPIYFGFFGLLAGLFVGGVYCSQCQKVYTSKATVVILPRKQIFHFPGNGQNDDSRSFDFRHDLLIGEDDILAKCLNKYGLMELPTLRDLPAADQVKEIQDHLVVSQNPYEPIKYELEYSSLNARDAQTILATILSTYEKHLCENYRDTATNPHKGFFFETTRPACRGCEVWPMLAVILPVAGLTGSLLGLSLGCLVALVVRAIGSSRV